MNSLSLKKSLAIATVASSLLAGSPAVAHATPPF